MNRLKLQNDRDADQIERMLANPKTRDFAGFAWEAAFRQKSKSSLLAHAITCEKNLSKERKNGAKVVIVSLDDDLLQVAAPEADEIDPLRKIELGEREESALDFLRRGARAIGKSTLVCTRRGQQIVAANLAKIEEEQGFERGEQGQGGLFAWGVKP